MVEQWAVLFTVILGSVRSHPEMYDLTMLIDALEEVKARLWEQARY